MRHFGSDLDRMIPVVTSSYYKEWMRHILPLFRLTRTRGAIYDAEGLLKLQDGIVKWLADFVLINQQEKRAIFDARDKGEFAEREDLEAQLSRNRHIMRVLQMICDGLAFRLLGFDRPFLRLTVNSPKNAASVDFSVVYPGMREAAIRLMAENGSLIIFNDITNVLRVGDITEVFPSGRIMIHELKKEGAKVQNILTEIRKTIEVPSSKRSKQMNNVVTAQMARDLRRIDADDGTIVIDNVGVQFQNNLDVAALVIRRARINAVATARVGDYLTIHCVSVDAIARQNHEHYESEPSPWDDSDVVYTVGNCNLFFAERSDYARNMTPYSVFPWSTQDCLNLMSGRLILDAEVNVSAIARLFAQSGWDAETVPLDQSALYLNRMKAGASSVTDDPIPAIRIRRGAFNLELPVPVVLRVGLDFMSPTMLIASAEHTYAVSTYSDTTMRDSFLTGEKRVWF